MNKRLSRHGRRKRRKKILIITVSSLVILIFLGFVFGIRFWHGPVETEVSADKAQLEQERLTAINNNRRPIEELEGEEKARAIAQRHLSAIGGLNRLNNLRSIQADGKITFSDEEGEKPFSLLKKGSGLIRIVLGFEHYQIILGYNRGDGWRAVKSRGAIMDIRPLGSVELDSLSRNADTTDEIHLLSDRGWNLEFTGEIEFDGHKVYVLQIKGIPNEELEVYIDQTTYYEVGRKQVRTFEGTEQGSVSVYRDFRDVDGYMLPFYLETKSSMRDQAIIFDEISVNIGVFDSFFQAPKKDG